MMIPVPLPCLQHFTKPRAALRSRFPAPEKANPDNSYFLSPTSVWSSKGRTGYGTNAEIHCRPDTCRLSAKADKKGVMVHALWYQGAVIMCFTTTGFANAICTAVRSASEMPSTGIITWFWRFGLSVYMLIPCRLCDTSQKWQLQASRLKDWKKNFFHLNYLSNKPRNLFRVGIFLLSGFPKCPPSLDAAKLIITRGEMEQSRAAIPHAQQGTWLVLLLSSNHATPFLTVTQISFCWSTRAGKFIMYCGSEEISSFEKQTTSTWLSFVGFSLT